MSFKSFFKKINELEKQESESNSILAMKLHNNFDSDIIQNLMKKPVELNRFHHPNINKIHGIFLGDENLSSSIFLHQCSQNIGEIIESNIISKSDAVCFIYEISEGMEYAHSLKIVHRNLKPSNIFISSDLTIKMMFPKDQLSLIDADDPKLFFFIAPEMKDDVYIKKVDIFSFGTLIYYILNL